MHLKVCILLCAVQALPLIASEESQFSINNNKAIQLVNERFISFSVDPAVFFSRLPHRDILLKLITRLSPAYLRVAGQSTQFLDFNADAHRATKLISDASTSLTFSPAMWWSLNEWMQKTNFTPIYGINDAVGAPNANEKWDAKRILPLLDMTAKMNVNCLWQLGFDCSEKGFERYKDDLKEFRQVLDAFPGKKDKWQIVGSDLSKCTPSDHSEILRMYLADLDHADAIMWEEDESIISNFLSGGVMDSLLSFHQATVPIWLSTPKSQHPIGFEDGITWAVEIGEAARKGFAVIFREPRLQEYYSATAAYWVTVLHKSLMGRNVLDVKSSTISQSEARIYAHCARDQNSFTVRGALTVMVINNGSQPHKAAFRLPTQLKSVEVRSYILTTMENTTDTYLNDEKLSLDSFKLQSKLRRAKVLTHLLLTAPAKSIAFFVLPGAKIPICIDGEDDTALILEEIERIQAVDFADAGKSAAGLRSRLNAPRVSVSLADLHRKLQEEFKSDAMLVPKLRLKSHMPSNDDWKQQLTVKMTTKTEPSTGIQSFKNLFMFEKGKSDLKKNLLRKEEKKDDILGSVLSPAKPKDVDLNLSSSEVFKILGDRARTKLEKKMGFTDFEFDLDDMLDKALKRKFRRDINMRLLDEKVHDQEDKEQKPSLPKFIKKKKVEVTNDSEEIEGLPDMSKIIPTFGTKPKSALPETSIFGNKAMPKFELFGGAEKLDLQSLLSLLGSKATTESIISPIRPTAKSEKTQFSKKPDLYDGDHEFDHHFNQLDDDLNGGTFFEHFGDSISVQPKKMKDAGAWDDDNAFLDNEFIINDDDVPGALRKLERFFNQDPQARMSEHFEPAFDSFEDFERFKRGMKQRGGGFESSNPPGGLRLPRNAEQNGCAAQAPSPNKLIRAYESKLDRKEWRPEDMPTLPKLHSTYQVAARGDQISFEDIPRSRGAAFGPPHSERINIRRRKARRVPGDVSSMENAIDSFLNTIEKDTKFIKPLLEREEGEYTVVLPTHEKLAVLQRKNGDTEIVLHRDAAARLRGEDNDNQVDDSTCAATDLYPGLGLHRESLKNALVHTAAAPANDGNREIEHAERRVNRSEYVQKIPLKPRKPSEPSATPFASPPSDKYSLEFVVNVVNGFSRFMKKLHHKMDSFFKAVE